MVDYDPFSVTATSDPHPIYQALRASAPVYGLPRYDAWALSRFAEVWEVLTDRERFSIFEGPVFERDKLLVHHREPPPTLRPRPLPSFSIMDPPQHTTLRRAMFGSFTPKISVDLAADIASLARRQLDELAHTARFDVVASYAGPVAVAATLRFLGLPGRDRLRLQMLINTSTQREPGRPGPSPAAVRARRDLQDYLRDQVAMRRAGVRATHAGERGDADVVDALLTLSVDSAPLSDDEIAMQLGTLLVGGGETLPKIIAGGLVQLARHGDQLAELRADANLLAGAFDEMVRLEGVLQFVGRTLLRDAVIGGQPMRAGQRVLLLLQSANRDEREFRDPDRFDIRRAIPRQVGFGHGIHFCIGVHAARVTATALLSAFLERYSSYEVDLTDAQRPPSEFQMGWTRLPVVVQPS